MKEEPLASHSGGADQVVAQSPVVASSTSGGSPVAVESTATWEARHISLQLVGRLWVELWVAVAGLGDKIGTDGFDFCLENLDMWTLISHARKLLANHSKT